MPADERPLSFEQPHSAFGTWVGVVLLFAVFGLFVWVVMGLMTRGDHYEQKRADVRMEKLKTASDEANTALHSYGWVDKAKGIAHVPIQRAMELTIVELEQKKPAPAGPIASPAAVQPGAQAAAPVGPSAAPTAPPQPPPNSSPGATSVRGPASEINGQPTGAANPPNAVPGSQPGPSVTPAASPPAPAAQPPAPPDQRGPTPVQTSAGTPIPLRPPQP